MDENRKRAYRRIIYFAMLDIRSLQWSEPSLYMRINPFYWRRYQKRIHCIAALADWLHNLASFSAIDFDIFDERHFWDSYQSTLGRCSETGVEHYREMFERELAKER